MADMKNILIIDDDPDILESITMVLEANGFETCTALSGKEGLNVYKNERPDCILCDMMMENVDEGTKVVHQIRQKDKNVPIFLISSIANETESKFDIDQLGFNGVFQKPLPMDKLISTIKLSLGMN